MPSNYFFLRIDSRIFLFCSATIFRIVFSILALSVKLNYLHLNYSMMTDHLKLYETCNRN